MFDNKSMSLGYNQCLDLCAGVLMKKWKEETNNQNCVNLCFEDEVIRKHLNGFLENCVTYKDLTYKNEELAIKFWHEGNKTYEKGNYEKCLSQYTESIMYAEPGKQCLPLAYLNRSEALLKLYKFEASLNDIDMALKTECSAEKILVLKCNKAKLLMLLGNYEDSEKIIKEIDKEAAVKESCQFIKNKLQEMKKCISETSISRNHKLFCNTHTKLPRIIGGVNNDFNSASTYLSVCYDNKKGRYVKATKDLQIGNVLFVEKPFAHVYFFTNVCHECGIEVCNLIFCDFCINVSYCSVDCKEKFWKSTHSFECNFYPLFKTIGIAHLSLRVILSASNSFNNLKRKLNKIFDSESLEKHVSIKSTSYHNVYNLEANIDKFNKMDVIYYTLTAFLLALYLKKHTNYFDKSSKNEDLKLLVSVLLRHIAHLICNGSAIASLSSSVSENAFNEENSATSIYSEKRIGTALYPSISMMNHSCEPSITTSFTGKYIVVRASKGIKKGEEVFNCYGPHARRMNRQERQKSLKSQYFFTCDCHACAQEFDIMDVFQAWKCQKCNGPSIFKQNENNWNKKRVCLNCGQFLILSKEHILSENLIYSLMAKGSLRDYLSAWRQGRKIYFKFHEILGKIADQISRLLYQSNEFEKSIKFQKCGLILVEKRYGSNSIELARELEKIAHSLAVYADVVDDETVKKSLNLEVINYFKKALNIFKLFCGESEMTKEIELKMFACMKYDIETQQNN